MKHRSTILYWKLADTRKDPRKYRNSEQLKDFLILRINYWREKGGFWTCGELLWLHIRGSDLLQIAHDMSILRNTVLCPVIVSNFHWAPCWRKSKDLFCVFRCSPRFSDWRTATLFKIPNLCPKKQKKYFVPKKTKRIADRTFRTYMCGAKFFKAILPPPPRRRF